MNKPIIGISMGDPAGIGPEVAVKALNAPLIHDLCRPVIIGDAAIIQKEMKKFSPGSDLYPVTAISACDFSPGKVNVLNLEFPECKDVKAGEVSAAAGKAAFLSVTRMIGLAMKGEIDASVTGPIHKKAINEAGYHYSGHTEIFAEYTSTDDYAMMLVSDKLKIIHVTTHVSLREACDLIESGRVLSRIRLMHQGLKKLGYTNPRIGVAGLNPHGGDEGLFGDEEIKHIRPAVEEAVLEGIRADGPVPPDTLFPKALGKHYDGCVAMYHDQGHIPLKLDGFKLDLATNKYSSMSGVNCTIGLPIIRASVDHGTAFGKAGEGRANEESLVDAINVGLTMAKNKFSMN
jgi:4-phospho-D-threonate 3-dehydrogenase / 4-phospho-D-erythronate 3-dehydrogenase